MHDDDAHARPSNPLFQRARELQIAKFTIRVRRGATVRSPGVGNVGQVEVCDTEGDASDDDDAAAGGRGGEAGLEEEGEEGVGDVVDGEVRLWVCVRRRHDARIEDEDVEGRVGDA